MMELESVWSGQKGVYVGSGLREMDAYTTRLGSTREPLSAAAIAVERYSEVQSAILTLLRERKLTRRQLVEVSGRPYGSVSTALDRLWRYGQVRKAGKSTEGFRCWLYEAVP